MAISAWKDAAVLKWVDQMRSVAKEAAHAAFDVVKEKSTNYTIKKMENNGVQDPCF
jgi:hypothetical protein